MSLFADELRDVARRLRDEIAFKREVRVSTIERVPIDFMEALILRAFPELKEEAPDWRRTRGPSR